jgi:hypothetical protein
MGCFGPQEDHFSIFGTHQTDFFYMHFLPALVIGTFLFLGLFFLNRKQIIKINFSVRLLITALVVIFISLLSAYFFPVQRIY